MRICSPPSSLEEEFVFLLDHDCNCNFGRPPHESCIFTDPGQETCPQSCKMTECYHLNSVKLLVSWQQQKEAYVPAMCQPASNANYPGLSASNPHICPTHESVIIICPFILSGTHPIACNITHSYSQCQWYINTKIRIPLPKNSSQWQHGLKWDSFFYVCLASIRQRTPSHSFLLNSGNSGTCRKYKQKLIC